MLRMDTLLSASMDQGLIYTDSTMLHIPLQTNFSPNKKKNAKIATNLTLKLKEIIDYILLREYCMSILSKMLV